MVYDSSIVLLYPMFGLIVWLHWNSHMLIYQEVTTLSAKVDEGNMKARVGMRLVLGILFSSLVDCV